MSSFLRPDTIKVDRKVGSTVGPTGEPIQSITAIQSSIPAMLDSLPVGSRMGGDLQMEIEGVVYIQTHVGFVDGLMPREFAGHLAGDKVTLKGVDYTVSANGRGAFADIRVSDRVTDQNLRHFLVLATAMYYNVTPVLELRLVLGRAW